MPTYDFVCKKCGHTFEQFQPMSAAPLRKCPKCGKLGVKRLIGAGAGLIFKGTGFYQTDYKKAQAPAGGGESSSGGGDSKSSEKAGDGKPASAEGKPASGESKPASGDSKAAPAKEAKAAAPAAKTEIKAKG